MHKLSMCHTNHKSVLSKGNLEFQGWGLLSAATVTLLIHAATSIQHRSVIDFKNANICIEICFGPLPFVAAAILIGSPQLLS